MRLQAYKAFISTIFLLVLYTSTTTTCKVSLKPAYTGRVEITIKKNYRLNTSIIAAKKKIEGLALLMFYTATYKKKNLDQAINLINKKFKEFQAWLLNEEHKALTALKNKFNINDEIWNNCLKDIDQLKNIYRQALQQVNPNAIHDSRTPYAILNTLSTLLTNNAINPQSVSIQIMDTPSELALMRLKAYVKYTIDSTDNSILITRHYTPIIIKIFPEMHKNINQDKTLKALCAHEIQHIIQCHLLTKTIVNLYLNHYGSVDDETLMNLPEFQQLIQIHEAQAELFSAINHPEIALCLCNYRKKECYPHYFYEDHFYNLSTIAMLWQLEKSLTWFHKANLINEAASTLKNTFFS